MSNRPNHRRGQGRRTEHGPRWESSDPGAGCNSTHVARGRRKWRDLGRRQRRREEARELEAGVCGVMAESDDDMVRAVRAAGGVAEPSAEDLALLEAVTDRLKWDSIWSDDVPWLPPMGGALQSLDAATDRLGATPRLVICSWMLAYELMDLVPSSEPFRVSVPAMRTGLFERGFLGWFYSAPVIASIHLGHVGHDYAIVSSVADPRDIDNESGPNCVLVTVRGACGREES